LKQAIKVRGGKAKLEGLIHHSDRGGQYVDKEYLKILANNKIGISMGLKGQENAYAERVNRIIKNEYLNRWEMKSFDDLKRKLKKAVNHYNEKRIHNSLPDKVSPNKFEELLLSLYSHERPKVIIYAESNYKVLRTSSSQYFKPREEPQAHNCPMVIMN